MYQHCQTIVLQQTVRRLTRIDDVCKQDLHLLCEPYVNDSAPNMNPLPIGQGPRTPYETHFTFQLTKRSLMTMIHDILSYITVNRSTVV